MRILAAAIIVLSLIGCTNKPIEEVILKINVSKQIVEIGDSIMINATEAGSNDIWQLNPNIGQLKSNWYMAPKTIIENNTRINITLKRGNQTAESFITITRGNKPDSTVSFTQTILPILQSNCNFSGCHGNGSRAGKVDLTLFDSIVKHVVVFKPQQSILILSLIKTDPLRRMPPAGPLNNNRIQLISNWIEQGALFN